MEWFRHSTDSLGDPLVCELTEKYGGNGYMILFGILEIYARRFKVADDWKLDVSLPYLKRRLQIYHKKILINCLETIKNSAKWDIKINEDQITIFIPNFRKLNKK